MPAYTQANRPIRAKFKNLGDDDLLLTGFSGQEAVSQLFRFTLELVAPADQPVAFDQVLGHPVSIALDLPGDAQRLFHGLVTRFSQGGRDDTFVRYRAEIAPAVWLLTKRRQSRIFQHVTVPDILKTVFAGLPVKFDGLKGKYEPRDYCTQYRESDFAFASRLMEEEGIFYFFTHGDDDHEMVLADTPQGHPDVPVSSTLLYEEVEGGNREEARITAWEKVQEMRAGKVTLWDHSFELPGNNLQADRTLQETVQVGGVAHKLVVGEAKALELYDYPGAYAQRYDGVEKGGGDQAAELQKIFQDNKRTAALRMQQEAAGAVAAEGKSNCGQLTAGHAFTLDRHFDADGDYVLTSVTHTAVAANDFRSAAAEFDYTNTFTCTPAALPVRPQRTTPRPTVRGSQTATVVGPKGEEIFTDKYGRVKVQFPWDREGKFDADSSCWIRVATVWAGQGWGVHHIPRIGQEVVVDFLEGDPDQPIIVGSVYNAAQMPSLGFPDKAMVSGIKSNSTPGGGGYNEFTLDDTKGKEKITVHGQYDMNTTVRHDQTTTVHNNRTDKVDVDDSETVGGNQKCDVTGKQSITVGADRSLSVGGKQDISVTGNQTASVGGDDKLTVTGAGTVGYGSKLALSVGADRTVSVTGSDKLTVTGSTSIDSTGAIKISSPASIELSVGGSVIKIGPASVEIISTKIDITGTGPVTVKGAVVKVNS